MDNLDVIATKAAGLAGAAVSLKFINGTWPERITMAVGGFVISLYFAPWAANKMGLPEGATGFLFGLFGMAICAKVWEAIQLAPVTQFWDVVREWFKKKLG